MSEGERLLCSLTVLWLRILIQLAEALPDIVRHVVFGNCLCIDTDHLGQVRCLLLHKVLHRMELVPKFSLHLAHVGPGVHPVRLNVLDLLRELFLLGSVAFNILKKVCLLGCFNYHLCDFLWSFHLGHSHLALESLLDDFCNRHVVYLLLRTQLSRTNRAQATGRFGLQENLILLLALLVLSRLLLELVGTLVRLLQLNLILRHGRLLALCPPLILNENLLEVLL